MGPTTPAAPAGTATADTPATRAATATLRTHAATATVSTVATGSFVLRRPVTRTAALHAVMASCRAGAIAAPGAATAPSALSATRDFPAGLARLPRRRTAIPTGMDAATDAHSTPPTTPGFPTGMDAATRTRYAATGTHCATADRPTLTMDATTGTRYTAADTRRYTATGTHCTAADRPALTMDATTSTRCATSGGATATTAARLARRVGPAFFRWSTLACASAVSAPG